MSKTMIKLLKVPTDADKLGPQQKACMNAVMKLTKGVVGTQVERTAVIAELTSGGELTTRQEPARILSFYQPQFKEKGLIDIVKVAEPKPEPAAKGAAPATPGAKPASSAKGTAPAAGAAG